MGSKCLFVNLYTPEYENRSENLGLEKLVYALEANELECNLIYQVVEKFDDINSVENVAEEILLMDFDVVGIPVFSTNISYVDTLFQYIKEKKNVLTIVGGYLASTSTRAVLEYMNHADYIFCGSSESLIVDFIKHIDQKEYLDNMKNIAYKLDGQVFLNERSFENTIQDLQIQAKRDYLQYRNFEVARLQTSRGCTSRCAFCTESEKWIGKSPEEIITEMRKIIERYGINTFNIIDSSFEDPTPGFGKDRIREFCNIIIDEGLDVFFTIYIRAESFTENDDIALLKLMKRAGLITAFVGIESGNEDTLRLFNKRADINANTALIDLMQKLYINLEAGFIMFHPYETFDQLEQNLIFFKNNKYIADNTGSYTNGLYVYPNTRIYKKLDEDKMLNADYSIANSQACKYIDEKVLLAKTIIQSVNIRKLYVLWEYLQKLYNIMSKAEKYSIFEGLDNFRNDCDQIKKELSNFNIYLFQELLTCADNKVAVQSAVDHITQKIIKFNVDDKLRPLDRFKLNFIRKNLKNVHLIIKKPTG